jgi:hypothetical protein
MVLRERFEAIIQEVVQTRESLVEMQFTPTTTESMPKDAGNEGADGETRGEQSSPEEIATQRAITVQRAQQNSRKEAHEILGVAEGFDEICEELINNRIDTEELKDRLQSRIAQPLRQIADEMFPQLDRRLNRLESTIADPQSGAESRQLAVAQLEQIFLSMRTVLSKMLELEDFNRAIALLREIIQSQQELTEKTKERRKESLRSLLED